MRNTAGKAWFRLQSALHSGTGHVVVTAEERDKAAALVDAALERTTALTVLRLRAASADPLAVIDENGTDAKSASKRRETLRDLLEKARAVDANVFAVVEDADTASAEELERVRMAVECVPDAIERLRVVLVGTPQLDLTLQEPAASALASRVSAHVRFAPPRKTAAGTALNTLSAIRVAAAGMMTVAVAALFGRNETPPHREAASQPASAREIAKSMAAASQQASAPAPAPTAASGDDSVVASVPVEVAAVPEALTNAPAATAAPVAAPTAPVAAVDSAAGSGVAEALPAANTVAFAMPDAQTEAPVAADGLAAAAEAAATAIATPASDAQPRTADADVPPDVAASASVPPKTRVADEAASARDASTAISQVSAQVARGERALREGSASVDSRGVRAASSVAPPKRSSPASTLPARDKEVGKRLKQPTVVEAAAFKDAGDAQSLQEQLAARFEHVQITRVESGRRTLYSVRVTDLESARDVAHAEREIRTLGHRPVRISQAAPRPTTDDSVTEDGVPPLTGAFRPGARRR
jgi:hypothetical protein